ncbi:MAG: hypothetical protein HY654_06900, partial [Acidobacteria bacterium]|nr:hypothetical protein [Acidobacteriota bacterium]
MSSVPVEPVPFVPLNRRALIRAIVISAVFVSWAPFIGEIRLALRNAFPATFIPAVATTMAVAIVVPCLIVLYRIRTRRLLRYSSIAAALTAVVVYWLTMR